MKPVLTDNYMRQLNYLRVSITDRCSLSCIYCMPSIGVKKLSHHDILSYEEITRLVRIFSEIGVDKVRVTGGEPFVRRGAAEFIAELTKNKNLKDISVTTNGVLLEDNLNALKDCGIKRLNISLDTLDREKFKKITGFDFFDKVWRSILTALENGFAPVKINVVVLNSINIDEINEFVSLTKKYPVHVRFIEYMPTVNPDIEFKPEKPFLAPEIRETIEKISPIEPLQPSDTQRFDGPAERFRLPGAMGEIGIIRPVSRHFCNRCNRLRLTASGQLKVCLLSDIHTDLKTPLRSGSTNARIVEIIKTAIKTKPEMHLLSSSGNGIESMSSIGG